MGCICPKTHIETIKKYEAPEINEVTAVVELARFCARCQQPNAEPVIYSEKCEYLGIDCWPEESIVICEICERKCIKNQRCICAKKW